MTTQINPLTQLQLGKNARGQWVVRDDATGFMALADHSDGMVVKPGTQPSEALLDCFAWALAQTMAADACTEREGCSPFKA